MGATRAGVGDLPAVMRPLHHGALVASPDNAEHHHNDDIEEETTMLDTEKLQEIAQEMAEMQKAMEQSGDTETRWTTAEIARQDLQERWSDDAEAAGLDPEDTETRDQLWDMVVEAYFGPTTPTTRKQLESAEDMAISALVVAWETMVDNGEMGEIEMAQSLIEQIEGGCQGWDASVEDAENHPEIAAMIGLDPEADPEDPDEMEDLWEAWGRVVGEAARRWLADHPEAAQAAREEA